MDYQSSSPSSVEDADSMQNFQFTFNVSAPTSGTSSFIEPDPNETLETYSASLSESVLDFPQEFGRTYHAYRAGSYAFPNDSIEMERLAVQNDAMTKMLGGRLFLSPLSHDLPPRAILDVATGFGDWAIQMGDMFPCSDVVGTDLSPIQPQQVPPNVNFYVEDSSEPWNYTEQFDFVHTRATGGSWSSFEKEVAQQAYENLAPGGYFEAQEFDSEPRCDDGTLRADSALSRWCKEISTASDLSNRPTIFAKDLKDVFRRVGFVDVQERMFKMPINPWPKDERLKELGRMWERNFALGLSGFCVSLFSRVFKRTAAEVEVALVNVRRELIDPSIHAYMPIYVVWGRKPYPEEEMGE